MKILLTVFAISCLLVPGIRAENIEIPKTSSKQFDDYWYPRGAEISKFSLEQSRYGEIHSGDAVQIFVTEPLNPNLQVKADNKRPGNIPILKLNFTRKFFTGVYPYSIMTSVFAPIRSDLHPLPLKISFTSQEWCGHVFMQLNLREAGYQVQHRSYFEKESDREFTVDRLLTEDGLWTLIRISPQSLPQGTFKLLPSATFVRLMHKPFKSASATGTLTTTWRNSLEGNDLLKYQVQIEETGRVLEFWFEKKFPHRIQEWKETGTPLSHFGNKALTTRAVRTHTIMTDYWSKNKNQHRPMLKDLGLKPN
jgi:hypothetical protein